MKKESNSARPFRTAYNMKETDMPGVINTQPSQAIPDQSLTIRQILEQYTRGVPMADAPNAYYSGDEVVKTTYDLIDVTNIRKEKEAKIIQLKAIAKQQKAEKSLPKESKTSNTASDAIQDTKAPEN